MTFPQYGSQFWTCLSRTDFEQGLPELNGLAVFQQNLRYDPFDIGFDLIHYLHCFHDADDGVQIHFHAYFDVGTSFG